MGKAFFIIQCIFSFQHYVLYIHGKTAFFFSSVFFFFFLRETSPKKEKQNKKSQQPEGSQPEKVQNLQNIALYQFHLVQVVLTFIQNHYFLASYVSAPQPAAMLVCSLAMKSRDLVGL